jgi:hypothetical protein
MAPCSALRLEDTHKGYRPLEDQFQVAPAEKLVQTTDPYILNEEIVTSKQSSMSSLLHGESCHMFVLLDMSILP